MTPEGLDDIDLRGKAGSAFVQAKSRRDYLGPFPAADAAKFVQQLWDRYETAQVKPNTMVLVLERPVENFTALDPKLEGRQLSKEDVIGKRLCNDPRAASLLGRTRLLMLGSPMEDAVHELSGSLSCLPLEAQIYYGILLGRICELADANGVRPAGGFAALSLSDIQGAIDSLRDAIAPETMQVALQAGLCEAVDFLTPLDDPLFFLGIDVQPGHLAAGLVAERPRARSHAAKLLERRRNLLIAGPSGSGKSALMWEIACAVRHVVRWFRVKNLSSEGVPLLLRLARTYRASAHAPVGFVVDDVGRGMGEGWDALAREVAANPGLVMLASIREEDMFPLTERSRATEMRETGDEELAERIWQELRARKQSGWEGWREPWRQSKGLLLEYVHLLTKGTRFAELLRDQVATRIRENRDDELAILRIASAASGAGVTVEADRLPAVLQRLDGDISRAIQRLLNEHLIRETGPGRFGGLHQLRSVELFRLCHETPPPTPDRTIAAAVRCVPGSEVETFASRTLESEPELDSIVLDAIAARLAEEPDASAAAGALNGLGQAHIASRVEAWLATPEVQALPRTQITSAAMFGATGVEVPDIAQLAPLATAARLLRQEAQSDPRRDLLRRLPPSVQEHLLDDTNGVISLNAFLRAIVGLELSRELRDRLMAIQPDLLGSDLDGTAELLGNARLIDPAIAEAWVETAGQQHLLDRIQCEVPWVSEPELRHEDEGLAACCNIRYVAASCQPDPHGEVVRLCRLLLAFAPRAALAFAEAVGPDDHPAGLADLPLASKRIARANVPPTAVPTWNQRWIVGVATRIANPSYTDYLARGADLLSQLVTTLEAFIDSWLRKGKVSDALCDSLNAVNEGAEALTPPLIAPRDAAGTGETEPKTAVTPLQSILFDCSVNLVKRFAELPKGANAYIGWIDTILEQVDKTIAEEPWELLPAGPPEKDLASLRELIVNLRLIAGEAGARETQPPKAWRKLARSTRPRNALRLIAHNVSNSVQKRLADTTKPISRELLSFGLEARVFASPKAGSIAPWPEAEILIAIEIDDVDVWQGVLAAHADALRAAVGDGRDVTLVPVVAGWAVDRLSWGGVETLFPRPNSAHRWLERERMSVLDDRVSQALGNVIYPASELSGIRQFAYGTQDRPAPEQDALTQILHGFEEARNELRRMMAATNPGLLERIESFANAAASAQIPLAADLSAALRGPPSNSVRLMNELVIDTLRFDLACATDEGS